MKNVLVVIDESNSSYDLLLWVPENLKDSIDNNKLLLLLLLSHYLLQWALLNFSIHFHPVQNSYDQRKKKNKKIALGILEKAKKISGNHGIKADTFTDIGDPKEPIHKIIRAKD